MLTIKNPESRSFSPLVSLTLPGGIKIAAKASAGGVTDFFTASNQGSCRPEARVEIQSPVKGMIEHTTFLQVQ